jgi:hypoxanthine phosphoribosyltransferase
MKDRYGFMASEFYTSAAVQQKIEYSKRRYDHDYMEHERALIVPGIVQTKQAIARLEEDVAKAQAQIADKLKAIELALQMDEVMYERARYLENPNNYYTYIYVEYWTKVEERRGAGNRRLKDAVTPMVTVELLRLPKTIEIRPYTPEEIEAETKKSGYVQMPCNYKFTDVEQPFIPLKRFMTGPVVDGLCTMNEEGRKQLACVKYAVDNFVGEFHRGVKLEDPKRDAVLAEVGRLQENQQAAEVLVVDARKKEAAQ